MTSNESRPAGNGAANEEISYQNSTASSLTCSTLAERPVMYVNAKLRRGGDGVDIWLLSGRCPFCGRTHTHDGGHGRWPDLSRARVAHCCERTYRLDVFSCSIRPVMHVLKVTRRRNGLFGGYVWLLVGRCPHCGETHTHGGGEGPEPRFYSDRLAHCLAGGYELRPAAA